MIHPLYHFYKNCMNGQLEIIFWNILSFFLDGTELYARPDTLSYTEQYGLSNSHCTLHLYIIDCTLNTNIITEYTMHTSYNRLHTKNVHYLLKTTDYKDAQSSSIVSTQ